MSLSDRKIKMNFSKQDLKIIKSGLSYYIQGKTLDRREISFISDIKKKIFDKDKFSIKELITIKKAINICKKKKYNTFIKKNMINYIKNLRQKVVDTIRREVS